MITIEGLGGKGAVWCAVRFCACMKSKISYINSYGPDYNDVLTAPPTAIYLPPVTASTIWFECSKSPYGPQLLKVEVGTLFGATTTPDQPNPCEHSTISGGLLAIGPSQTRGPNWLLPSSTQLSYNGHWFYCRDGSPAEFARGCSVDVMGAGRRAYARNGVLVPAEYYSGTAEYIMYTDHIDRIGSSIPFYPHGIKQNEWYCNRPSWVVPTQYWLFCYKTECTHVSARVWKEVKWFESHCDIPGLSSKSVSSDTGLGYTAVITKRTRLITLSAIQSTHPTVFNGRYDVEETLEYSYNTVDWDSHHYVATETSLYSFVDRILVLSPGLASGTFKTLDALNHYCDMGHTRAMELYRCKDATTARSSAIADVSGLESNWIENLSQVKGTADIVLPLLNGWKAVKNGDITAGKRALIGAYLGYMYAIAPSIRDAKDLHDNLGNVTSNATINRLSQERRRGKLSLASPVLSVTAELAYYCTILLKLKDNPIASIGNALEKLGLNPSAANIWDLIPFSFVVDWFLHIGPILSRLDAYENSALLRDVQSRVETFKVRWPLTMSEVKDFVVVDYSIATPLFYSWYDRRVLSGLGSFDPLSGQSHDGLSVSQMTQGGALLSSYKK